MKKKGGRIGRFVQHPHNTHTAHTAQHTLYNVGNDEEFALTRHHMDGPQLYHALQQHTVSLVVWDEMMDSQPVEHGVTQFDWRCLQLVLADTGVMLVDGACRQCMPWVRALAGLRPVWSEPPTVNVRDVVGSGGPDLQQLAAAGVTVAGTDGSSYAKSAGACAVVAGSCERTVVARVPTVDCSSNTRDELFALVLALWSSRPG